MRALAVGLGTIALGLTVLGVTFGHDDEPTPDGGGLTVFVAASLRDVADGLRDAWLAEQPDLPLTLAAGGTDLLAAQIAEGAGADVLLAADLMHPAELAAAGIGTSEVTPFARTELAVAVAAGSRLAEVAELARPGLRIAAAGPEVPISRYAVALVDALARTRPDPDTYRAGVDANVVTREDNVRTALAKVELGEADAAIVYATDIGPGSSATALELPADVGVEATYAALAISDRAASRHFVSWLGGPAARAVLIEAGFSPVAP